MEDTHFAAFFAHSRSDLPGADYTSGVEHKISDTCEIGHVLDQVENGRKASRPAWRTSEILWLE